MDLPDNVHVLPRSGIVRTTLTVLRNRRTPSDVFRAHAIRLGRLVMAEAVNEEPLEEFPIRTPLEAATGFRFRRGAAGVVTVLRAGKAFMAPCEEMLPNPKFWDLGLSRDEETLEPSEYMCKVPRRIGNATSRVYVTDPMFATGGSATYAVDLLKSRGARRIVFVGMVGVPEAVERMHALHPDVPIYLASLEGGLNAHGYIERDAIGDLGDRFHNSF